MHNSILIADDNEKTRRAVRSVLEHAGFTVCAEAGDGVDAVDKVDQFSPDLVLLDLRMPKMSGIEAASILSDKFPALPIILLTMFEVSLPLASAAGVTAVIAKSEGAKKLTDCVQGLLAPPPYDPASLS
ncbi:MAG: response regulator [Candidatus Acidiferrales bacterium]